MFVNPEEIRTHLADYQVEQITRGDESIVISAIDAAIAEVKAYIASRYDVTKIFSAVGADRSPLIIIHVKNIAVWNLVRLANTDAIFEQYRQAYSDSVDFLTKVADGRLVPDLPYRSSDSGAAPGTIQISSNTKFKHDF